MEGDPPRSEPEFGPTTVIIGVAAIVLGIGAIVLADQTQITLTKILSGDFYLKDAYRSALRYSGIGLIALGSLATLTGSLLNADPSAVDMLRVLTLFFMVVVIIGGGLLLNAYVRAKDQQQTANSPVTSTDTTSTDTTGTDTSTDTTTTDTTAQASPAAASAPAGAPSYCTGTLWKTRRDGAQICRTDHSLLSDTRLSQLRWDSWGGNTATASGSLDSGCNPTSCDSNEAVNVELSNPQQCPDGTTIYTHEKVSGGPGLDVTSPNGIDISCDGTAGAGGG